jgi:imidazolonepropionase-like amidohydrolase
MPQQNPKPTPPLQLLMPLDSQRLRGMSPMERGQVVTCLAALLLEASEDIGTVEEQADDRL